MRTYDELRRKWFRSTVWHWMLTVFTILIVLFAAILIGLYTLFSGPSRAMSDRIVSSVTETSALKFLPYLFMPADEVDRALDRTSFVAVDSVTNTDLYSFAEKRVETAEQVVPKDDDTAEQFTANVGTMQTARTDDGEPITIGLPAETAAPVREDPYGVGEGIEIVRIVGTTYKGYMAIIDDPARVSVGTCGVFGANGGKRIEDIASSYGAGVAVNGGAFADGGGSGNGGSPAGIVVSQGEWLRDAVSSLCTVGFDRQNRLIVGSLTNQQARQVDFRDAVGFGPALIVNGVAASSTGKNSSLNPRTAIGQRADGAVLLLVLDGRQLDSLGASMADLVEIMQKYGAINACNLDGGSSSVMIVKGQQLNDGIAVTGSRRIPTAIIVR